MKEREIKLSNFIIELLVHWRVLILLIFVGGILFGGISFMHSSVAVEEQFSLSELEKNLKPDQKAAVKKYMINEEYYQSKLNYLNNAALMRVNSEKVPRIELIFGITGGEESDVNFSIIYGELLSASELDSYVSERVEGISERDMGELVMVIRNGSTSDIEKTRTIQVIIDSPDKETCEGIADAVLAYVNSKKIIVEKTFGQHGIIVLNQSYVEVDNNNIRIAQRDIRNEIVLLEESLENSRVSWKNDVVQYYELLSGRKFQQGKEDGMEEDADKVQASLRYRIKYVMMGIVLAGFLYVFCVFMTFVLNKKLCSTDDISELFEISCLGYIPNKKEKAKRFGFVDRWIDSLKHRNQKVFSVEEAIHLAIVAVSMAAKKNGTNSICYIGCNFLDNGNAACKDIEQGLKERGVQQEVLNNILYDAESMEKLNHVAVVVLVEKVGVTLYSEVVQELQLLKRQGIPVLGMIVME